MELISNQFEGGRKYTCAQARQFLLEGRAVKILWRPNRTLSVHDPDGDPALVWFNENDEIN